MRFIFKINFRVLFIVIFNPFIVPPQFGYALVVLTNFGAQ